MPATPPRGRTGCGKGPGRIQVQIKAGREAARISVDAISLARWTPYLTAEAGVAAALTGLVFAAVSINLTRVISNPGLTGRAAESPIQFV